MEQNANTAEWIAAYLEWTDAEGAGQEFAEACIDWTVPARTSASDVGGEGEGLERLRESVLVWALRTESDCMHILRKVLDERSAAPDILRLAYEGLEHAERMLENEQRAWHALTTLRNCAWATGFDSDWPHAFEGVVTDVRALAGKVLELRPH